MSDRTAQTPAMAITPREALRRQQLGTPLVDIRPADERANGCAQHALVDQSPENLEQLRLNGEVLLMCTIGKRSLALAEQLNREHGAGFVSVAGGFDAWAAAGLPSSNQTGLSAEHSARYARHLVLPGVGPEGQQKLNAASVLVIGAGGLGSPAALYLAAAGVGRLGIVDDDVVEVSNLQRQILHQTDAAGQLKTDSAQQTLQQLNPLVTVETHSVRLRADNVETLIADWDIVIDGSDNFPTRYLLNDACLKAGIPLVYGAVMRFEGQVSVFDPASERGHWPCYRCLFPSAPEAEDAPDCTTAGVLGVLPGLVGTLQATETLKWLLGLGDSLKGRLLRINALTMRFSESRVRADPQCSVCADNPQSSGAA